MSVQELQEIISPKFTEQVVFDIIKKKSGLVSDIKVKKIEIGNTSKKGDSYLSNICRFKVEATGRNAVGKEETVSFPVITKYLPKNIGRRKTYRSTDFFENEVIFYEKVWEEFKTFQDSKNIEEPFDNIPLVLSSYIDGTNDYISMLDVSYEGYRDSGRGTGLNYEYTTAILNILARFHSLSLAFKDQQPEAFENAASSLKETYFAEKYRSWYERFQAKLFDIFRHAVSKELPPLYLDRLNRLLDSDLYGTLCKICAQKGDPLSVVTHGDVWVCNFLTKMKNSPQGEIIEKIMMIDFQLTRYSILSTDLTFFLWSCVEFDIMEKHWDDFINSYHKTLVENLEKLGSSKDLVTLEALRADIKTASVFGVGMCMESLVMSLLEDDEVSDLDAIQGDDAVPLESVWIIHPHKDQEKRKRIANLIKFAVDKESFDMIHTNIHYTL